MGRGSEEFHADASLAADALADVDHTALLFGLVASVGEKEALAARDDGFEGEQAAVLTRVNGVGFFVERLFILAGAVDEERRAVPVAQPLPAIPVVGQTIFRASRYAAGVFRGRPSALGVPQCFPDTAQGELPRNCPALGREAPNLAPKDNVRRGGRAGKL